MGQPPTRIFIGQPPTRIICFYTSTTNQNYMFLYVNHQTELYVFIRQPPTRIICFYRSTTNQNYMFLYVNHQPEWCVFIGQPPTSISLPLRYSFVWALQGNSISSQPFKGWTPRWFSPGSAAWWWRWSWILCPPRRGNHGKIESEAPKIVTSWDI